MYDSLILDYSNDPSLVTPTGTDTEYDMTLDPYATDPATTTDPYATSDPAIDTWSSYEYQQQVYDESFDAWEDRILEQDDVYSPSQDQYFEVPYDAYDEYGPDGAGYYGDDGSGGYELLTPVE